MRRFTAVVARGLGEVISLVDVELNSGEEGVFAKSNGGRGKEAEVEAALEWLRGVVEKHERRARHRAVRRAERAAVPYRDLKPENER